MKRCLSSLICLLTALHLVGGHWGVLQVVAWARMLAENTQQRGFLEGVSDTFDGEHPCEMCRQIALEKQKEESRDKTLPLGKTLRESLLNWYGVASATVMPPDCLWEQTPDSARGPEVSLKNQWDAPPVVPPPERRA